MVVVVALPALYVVEEHLRHLGGVLPVSLDHVGDVVAHHPTEPTELLPLAVEILTHVGRGHDADGHLIRIPSCGGGSVPHRRHGPLQHLRIGELEDVAVSVAPDGGQGLGTVAGHPHGEVPPLLHPGDAKLLAVVLHLSPGDQGLDHPHGADHGLQRGGLGPDVAEGGVAAAHPADGPPSVHFVEGGEQRGEHRPVPGARIGHHRPHHHLLRGLEHLGVDDERLLPEDMAVEGPPVAEPQLLGQPGQLDHPTRRGVGLEDYAKVHHLSLSMSTANTSGVTERMAMPAYPK